MATCFCDMVLGRVDGWSTLLLCTDLFNYNVHTEAGSVLSTPGIENASGIQSFHSPIKSITYYIHYLTNQMGDFVVDNITNFRFVC